MATRNVHVCFVIRMPNGQYLRKVNTSGTSSGVKQPTEALQFPSLEEAEGYVSQYLHRDANCLGVVKVTIETEVVRESCIG